MPPKENEPVRKTSCSNSREKIGDAFRRAVFDAVFMDARFPRLQLFFDAALTAGRELSL